MTFDCSIEKLFGNDVITVVLPNPVWDYTVEPEDIPLDIIYEDDELLIVNKKAGMVAHRFVQRKPWKVWVDYMVK